MIPILRLVALLLCLATLSIDTVVAGNGASSGDGKVPWTLTVVLLDGVDPFQEAEIPVREAVSFIEARTRLRFNVEYVADYSAHELTPYAAGPDYDGDGKGDEVAYLMMGWNLRDPVIDSLPVSTSYLFLYRLNGYRPLQGGSAVGLDYGILKGGKRRPYATVPTDQWWYVNEAHEGFESRAAQVLTHEIINTIQGKIEAAPYRCRTLTATWGLPAMQYESERLLKLSEACYAKLGNNAN